MDRKLVKTWILNYSKVKMYCLQRKKWLHVTYTKETKVVNKCGSLSFSLKIFISSYILGDNFVTFPSLYFFKLHNIPNFFISCMGGYLKVHIC